MKNYDVTLSRVFHQTATTRLNVNAETDAEAREIALRAAESKEVIWSTPIRNSLSRQDAPSIVTVEAIVELD